MENRFLWVEFQLKAICEQVSDYGIEETLRNIPEDIHGTYERILEVIDKKPLAQRDLARKALLFVAYSRKPVEVEVLALAIAAKDHTQNLKSLWSSISTKEIILHVCGNLLTIEDTYPQYARFVHFSVHEFLTSPRSKFIYALSLEKEMAHREIARMCVIFLLILYSHLQRYCSGIFFRFVWDYILPTLPYHLLAGGLSSLSSNDEMIYLTSLFFEKSPPMLAPGGDFCAFSPSVLALIFNLPGIDQCYKPEVLHGTQLYQKVFAWIYGAGSRKFVQVFDNRLAMHYAVSLDSVAACQRLYTHRYPIEYSYHNSDGPLNVTAGTPQFCTLTPLYLVQSEEVARFLLDRGVSVNPQKMNSRLPNLLGHLARVGNTKAIQFLLHHGAELQDKALDKALVDLASKGKVEDMRLLLDKGADANAQGRRYGNALHAAAWAGNTEAVRLLLDKEADVNAQGGEYGNALQAATYGGNIEAVRLLLDKGADVNAQGGKYGSALQAAALKGNIETVRFLLDQGADVNAQGGWYGNALQAAAAAVEFNIETVRFLLDKGADVHAQGGEYGSALQASASKGNIEAVRLLLDKGADVNAQGGFYGNALQAAAVAVEHNIEAVRFLLDKGADVNAQGGEYGSALQAAASKGNVEFVRLLLDKGADVNAQGGFYGNALQASAWNGNIEVVRLLLDEGADVNAQGGEYGSALQGVAAVGRFHEVNIEVFRLLLDKGADVNAQGGQYGNALNAAASKGSTEAVRLLLDKGADVNAQGRKYGNALHAAAASKGNIEAMQFLLDKGVDVNAQGGRYGNALQAAASNGNIESMQFLLDKGADINMQGGKYGNALQAAAVAVEYNIEAVRFLLDKGADVNAQGGKYGSALQAAVSKGNIEVIQFLLDKGADVNAQGGIYGTALQAALVIDLEPHYRRHKYPLNTAKILLDHGADVTAYVAGSPHGDALSAAKALWRDDEGNLAEFMKLLESKGWKEGESESDENGLQV